MRLNNQDLNWVEMGEIRGIHGLCLCDGWFFRRCSFIGFLAHSSWLGWIRKKERKKVKRWLVGSHDFGFVRMWVIKPLFKISFLSAKPQAGGDTARTCSTYYVERRALPFPPSLPRPLTHSLTHLAHSSLETPRISVQSVLGLHKSNKGESN